MADDSRCSTRSSPQLTLKDQGQYKYARTARGGRHQLTHKALVGGRCRKIDVHWAWLYAQPLAEFERLGNPGINLLSRLLLDMNIAMIKDLEAKKQVSETQMAQIEQFVARHLVKVKRLFDDGQLKPDQ
ncbi:Membrane protein [Phytophthora palmivora]|uniref:Membrane protein n=1 Tax=Phytophthora palmivora TaxID=4796 RepID=A0A2P4YFS3_9STRA|nr:Membrane protein [Phytophthora palmivora]